MHRPLAWLPALRVGLGVGAVGGALFGRAGIWPGLAVGAVGVGLSLVRPPAVTRATEPTPPGRADHPVPGLVGAGSRVEQILRLAKEQAETHVGAAEREAERIRAEARAEARAILERAQHMVADPDAPAPPQ